MACKRSGVRSPSAPPIGLNYISVVFFTLAIVDFAEVVKLVDALDSKSSEGDLMWVRFPPSAPVHKGARPEDFFWACPVFLSAGITCSQIKGYH
jgi:hypothetical protein